MKIIDTVPYFLENYHPSVGFLRSYFSKSPDVFKEYFAYHCKDTEERHRQSLEKYPGSLANIKEVYRNIIPIIEDITQKYFKRYKVTFPIEVNLIVGGFGSNAYNHRQIIPNITFALERLSPEPDHLKAIVAHEFGHAAHNILSNEAGLDWANMKWDSPLIWLYQEGAATHFSRRIVPNLKPSVYYSFNDEGDEWLAFAEENKKDIKREFAKDYAMETGGAIFREWFSINGGERFGHSRLGYFLGDLFFQHQVKGLGEMQAITAWKETNFIQEVESWLREEDHL
jgi:hypothetical protein